MKISTKITISFLATAIILSTIASSTYYFRVKAHLKKLIEAQLETIVKSRTQHIKTYLEMMEISVGQLSKSVVLENYLLALKDNSAVKDQSFKLAMIRLENTKKANPTVEEFLLLDANGQVVASSNPANIGEDKSTDAYFSGGQNKTYIKDAYFSDILQKPVIGASAPILNSQTEEFLGVLVARVELAQLNQILTDKTGLFKTGEIYIVNKYGFMITPSRFLSNTFLQQKVDTQNLINARLHWDQEEASEVKENASVFPNYLGTVVLGTHEHIPQMHWVVVGEIGVNEVFAPIRYIFYFFLGVIILVPFFSWLAGLYTSRLIAGPIHKLHQGTEIIGKGNLDYKVGTNANDEIGQLSRAFDEMTDNLKQSTTSIEALNREIEQRKKTEEALKESERKSRAILDQTFQFIGLMSTDGTLIEVNKAALELGGIEPGAVLNKPFWDGPWWSHSRELQDKLREAIKKAAAGTFMRFEATHPAKDGSLHNVDFSLKPVKDEAGKVVFLIPEGRDITDRKRKDEQIQLLASIVQSSDDAIITKTLDGIITSWNFGAEKIYGYSEEEVKNKPITIVIPPDHHAEIREILEKIKKGEHFEHFETIRQKKDKGLIDVSLTISPIYDANNKIIGASTIARDITERKKSEEKILRAANEWQRTFDAITDLVFIQDTNFTIIRANKIFAQALKLDLNQIIGKKCYQLLHKSDKPWPDCPFGKTISDYQPHTEEVDDPNIGIPLLVSTSPIFDAQGKLLGSVHIAKDISNLKKAQEELQKYSHELEGALKVKSSFTSMVSHELRTPLAAIKESVNLVYEGAAGKINVDQKDLLDTTRLSVDRLARLINNILDFQKLESGTVEFNFAQNNLNSVVKEVYRVMSNLAQGKGLKFSISCDENMQDFPFDRDKIIQVITNLVNNAIKFTDQGSVEIITVCEGNAAHIQVKDSGPGIKQGDMQRLFKSFEQLETTREKKSQGSGIGLAISKEIIMRHNGKIWAESEFGKGATFHFVLPLKERRENKT